MGFDVSQVISDDRHYGPFICTVCQNLVSLDAPVVTLPCSHPFCRTCLEGWAAQCGREDKDCSCPACQQNLSLPSTSKSPSLELGGMHISAQPLETSQPLAYAVLKQVQVACVHFSCGWSGDYGNFLAHALKHSDQATSKNFLETSRYRTEPKTKHPPKTKRPSMSDAGKSLSMPSVVSTDSNGQGRKHDGDSFDKPQVPGIQSSHARKSELDSTDHEQPISLESLKSALLEPPRWSSNGCISTDPVVPKTTINGARTGDAPPLFVKRTKSDDGNNKVKVPPITRHSYSHSHSHPNSSSDKPQKSKESEDLEGSYTQSMDWNASIGFLGANWNHSFNSTESPAPAPSAAQMETVAESQESAFELQMEPEDDAAGEEEKKHVVGNTPLLETKDCEKLRKQANAKFNKGEFKASRLLYTEAIDVMESLVPSNNEECELVSNLYSNRAVTFFREKKFDNCIEDCDKAIAFDPSYEKSWIRKWRALMALGNFDAAYTCLEMAAETVGESSRIEIELDKARLEQELITDVRALLEKGKFSEAKEKLKPHAMSSDNIGLLFLAARADCGLGHTESALEKVNRALRFNPTHVEGLEIRGYALFLSGETEKGAHLLQDVYIRDKDNKEVRLKLSRCQKTHSAFSQGRSCVKRGRYKEAVDHFTTAMKVSGEVPKGAPLFSVLRTERAEAWLLSKKFLAALEDCYAVINVDTENATAWAIRSEVLVTMGKADEAKDELSSIRRTWGRDNPTIDEAYRRVDFELRVQKADGDLDSLVAQLQAGTLERVVTESGELRNSDSKVPERKTSVKDERQLQKGALERVVIEGDEMRHSRNSEPRVPVRKVSAKGEPSRTRAAPPRKPSTDDGERRSSSKSRNGRDGERRSSSKSRHGDAERRSSSKSRHGDVERRSSSKSRNGRRSKSRVNTRHHSSGSDLILAAVPVAVQTAAPSSPGKRKSAFVPPPSYEDFSREADVATARPPKPSHDSRTTNRTTSLRR
jgi:tetratricopeptide (TPR) repeat protein